MDVYSTPHFLQLLFGLTDTYNTDKGERIEKHETQIKNHVVIL